MSVRCSDTDPARGELDLFQAERLLRERFGHREFRSGQADALKSVFAGRNLLAVMPTGSGKSLLYQLPALMHDGLTLVVSPLIALMKDQVDDLSSKGVPCTYINSSVNVEEQQRRLHRCGRGEVKLLYVAPERFQNASFIAAIQRMKIARMAVDEAHCISQWGHDFRPDYRRLRGWRHQIGSPLVTALTATATPDVQRDIVESLGLDPQRTDVHVHGFARSNLMLSVVKADTGAEKDAFLWSFLRAETGSGIIYAGTRRCADELAERLKELVPNVRAYHAGMEPEQRTRAQDDFLGGKSRVVVATVAFGMGIDKPDVRFVVHYHFPGSVESYYQEIGRAGRDGLPARCTLLYSPGDRQLREFFIDLNYPDPSVVEMVYEALWEISDNPIEMTYEQIADRCGDNMKSGHVGAAIRLLDQAGVTRSRSTEASAAALLRGDISEALKDVRAPAQRRVIEALVGMTRPDSEGWFRFGLGRLAGESGLSEDQARRALLACEKDGRLEYNPPFRGRGVEKTVAQPPPFDQLNIDWRRQELRRRGEEDKLDRMESYIRARSCRHGFILKYFGETGAASCSRVCDNCRERGGPERVPADAPQRPGRAPLAHRESADNLIRLAALRCVRGMARPIGVQKVVEVITGSNAKWIRSGRASRLPAYGEAPVKQDHARSVVEEMIRRRLLEQELVDEYPVLRLTDKGQAELERLAPSPAAAPVPVAAAAPAPSQEREHHHGRTSVRGELDRLTELILVTDRERAKSVADELRLFHPQVVFATLAARYEAAAESRRRSRAVWAVGELCGQHGGEFLARCA